MPDDDAPVPEVVYTQEVYPELDRAARVDRIFERVHEIIDMDPEHPHTALARDVWLRAQETNLKQISKEALLAFADEVYVEVVYKVDQENARLHEQFDSYPAAFQVFEETQADMLRVIQEAHRAGYQHGMGPCVCVYCKPKEKTDGNES